MIFIKPKKKRQYSALAQAGPRRPGVQGHSFHANFLLLLGTVPWNAPELLRSPGNSEPDNCKLPKLPSCLWEENEIATGITGLGPDGGDGPEVKREWLQPLGLVMHEENNLVVFCLLQDLHSLHKFNFSRNRQWFYSKQHRIAETLQIVLLLNM